MSTFCVIARRLESGTRVQYGSGGIGGCFREAGVKIMEWYDKPEMVEYLFDLGQLKYLGIPGRESCSAKRLDDWYYKHEMTEIPHWLGRSEEEIFSRGYFSEYAYFYDLDNRWYFVINSLFCIKIPLAYMYKHMEEIEDDFREERKIKTKIAEHLLGEYYEADKEFHVFFEKTYPRGIESLKKAFSEESYYRSPPFWGDKEFRKTCEYFDHWVVIKTNDDDTAIREIIIKKKQNNTSEKRIETIYW